MEIQVPVYDPIREDEVLDEHGLSKEMARKLHAAPCQMRPRPAKITSVVWQEAKTKVRPHGDDAPPQTDAKSWHRTVEQCATVIYELKHNKAPQKKSGASSPTSSAIMGALGASATWGKPGKDLACPQTGVP